MTPRDLDAKVAEAMGWVLYLDGKPDEGPDAFWQNGKLRYYCDDGKLLGGISTSGRGLLAMLTFHAEAGRVVGLLWDNEKWMADVGGALEGGEVCRALTPGAALAAATVAWKERAK